MKQLIVAVFMVLLGATFVDAACKTAPGGLLVCAGEDDVGASQTIHRESGVATTKERTSLCLRAKKANSADIRCGPTPVTTSTGWELTAGDWYCWDQVISSSYAANVEIGCISESGSQKVSRGENFK